MTVETFAGWREIICDDRTGGRHVNRQQWMNVEGRHSLSHFDVAPGLARVPDKMTRDSKAPVIFVVEDDGNIRQGLQEFLEAHDLTVESFESAESFLRHYRPGGKACLLLDLSLGDSMSGLQLLSELKRDRYFLPVVVISGNDNLGMAIEAMRSGAADYIQKPFNGADILSRIERVLTHSCFRCKYSASCIGSGARQGSLTPRQKHIMGLILTGHPSKNIAADLGISQRTVENHRAAIMRKTGSKSIAELARVSLATPWHGIGECPPCFTACAPANVRASDRSGLPLLELEPTG
jgi:two-component system CheB/CheR fusion protein